MPNLFIFLPWNQSSTEHSAYERKWERVCERDDDKKKTA